MTKLTIENLMKWNGVLKNKFKLIIPSFTLGNFLLNLKTYSIPTALQLKLLKNVSTDLYFNVKNNTNDRKITLMSYY